jgi:sugar fermentation stimulation protein A
VSPVSPSTIVRSPASRPAEAPSLKLPPLHDGRILRRYQRFLADVELHDGRSVTAHVPNTGSMATCWEPGAAVQLSHSDNPRRKLAWTLERIDMGQGWIGVNTARPNAVLAEAIAANRIPGLGGYRSLRREVPFAPIGLPSGRLDVGLSDGPAADALVEIKNVTLLDGERLRFPDARSERGRKHLALLAAAVAQGRRGIILFALNRPEGTSFAPAWAIDPDYGRRLLDVLAVGVEAIAVRLRHDADAIEADGTTLPIDLSVPA